MSIAWRNLFKDTTRLALSIGGRARVAMLILLRSWLPVGMNAEISAAVGR